MYELEQWVQRIDPKCHGLRTETASAFNDDRFGRALDKLYLADRASLMTEIVMKMINDRGQNVQQIVSKEHFDDFREVHDENIQKHTANIGLIELQKL